MKGLAIKLNLPQMNNSLIEALTDFGEDRVIKYPFILLRHYLFSIGIGGRDIQIG